MNALQNPNTTAPTGAGNAVDARRDSAGSQQQPTPRGLLALLIAGALLQRRGHKITMEPGGTYPMAVRRIVQAMPPAQRQTLRSEVEFLLTTDLRFGPFTTLSQYQQPPD